VEEGVTPTTTKIHLIQYGPKLEHASTGAVSTLAAPLPLLEEVNFVDTPGTNAISREHEAITLDFIPRSDLVLFVTSADRPFTESERAFMEKIKNWGKKIVVFVRLSSNVARLAATVVYQARNGSFLTALPLISQPASQQIVPHLASDSVYFTGIAIANPNWAPLTGKIELYAKDGVDWLLGISSLNHSL
jgi:hypothetical protein